MCCCACHCADLFPDLCPTRCHTYGAPGLHRARCRTNACSKEDHWHGDCCRFIPAQDAADCPTTSPPSCRNVADARCAYGARAPERVPAVPPACGLSALDLAECARAKRERDNATSPNASCFTRTASRRLGSTTTSRRTLPPPSSSSSHITPASAPFLPCSV